MFVVARVVEILVTDEKLDRFPRRIQGLHESMAHPPFGPIAILHPAAERFDPGSLQLVAGLQQFGPGLGRRVGVQAGFVKQILVVIPDHRQRIPAGPVGVAAKVAQNRWI